MAAAGSVARHVHPRGLGGAVRADLPGAARAAQLTNGLR